jgi:hypothetical protein
MSSSTNGVSHRPQVSLGEACDPTDFNAESAWSRAYINDLIINYMARVQASGLSAVSLVGLGTIGASVFSIGSSGAPRIRPSAGNLAWGCNPGPLFFVPSTTAGVDGITPQVLCYHMSTDEMSGAFAAADPTNPRFDAVYVRVSEVDGPLVTRNFEDATGAKSGQNLVTERDTKLEWSVVQGTPSQHPLIGAAPDSTWTLWGVWFIPANYASPLVRVYMFDYRIPCSIRSYRINAGQLFDSSGSNTLHFSRYWTGGATTFARAPTWYGRIMAVRWAVPNAAAGGKNTTTAMTALNSFASVALNKNYIYAGTTNLAANMTVTEMDGYVLARGLWIKNGTSNNVSPNGFQLLPLWSSGYGNDTDALSSTDTTTARLEFDDLAPEFGWAPANSADEVVSCTIEVAA